MRQPKMLSPLMLTQTRYFKAFLNITPSLRVLMSCDADLNNIWQDVKKKMLLNPNVIKKS